MDNYDYQALVNEVVRRGINMFGNFEDWTKGAFAFADLGEKGRSMFKAISSISDKYREKENDYKFSHALRTRGRITIACFSNLHNSSSMAILELFARSTRTWVITTW